MPIRIYDISVMLGIENKEVLSKAKELGIAAAKVPSSSLDKISGEWLVEEIIKSNPAVAERMKKKAEASPVAISVPPANVERRIVSSPPPPTPPPVATPVPASSDWRNASRPQRAADSSVPTPQPETKQILPKPASPLLKFDKPSRVFEERIRKLIDEKHPFCALSNVFLFQPQRARFAAAPVEDNLQGDYALEFDHLLHRATASKDVLTIIECKNQPINQADNDTWETQYTNKDGTIVTSNVQEQVTRHAKALRRYLNPLSRGRGLKVEAVVVSSDPRTISARREVNDWLSLFLMSENIFTQILSSFKPSPLRVVQSDLLGLLRLGIPVPELGHPELPNAIAYIERCRRDLDIELFRAFEPTKERWAINGSAGMGKSVLLAYSLFVLTTDRRITIQGDSKQLSQFGSEAQRLGLPHLGQRGVYAFALKEKQLRVLETLYRRFVDDFSALNNHTELGVRRPHIQLWNGKIPDDCHVLVLDEAHDLSSPHAKLIADWANDTSKPHYLLIACDRHQKLRLVGRDENIIPGLSFSLKTKKLRLNYRNPLGVYSASLGLMFRWFAKDGPKVIPTKDDLENGFGFTVEDYQPNGPISLSMRNEAHPANSWSDCVSVFPSCEAALARLRPNRLEQKDVLWVRFCDEDEHFDYEELSGFTYHNLNSLESVDLTDKYIKGQDFPIVVIEGFSESMNTWSNAGDAQIMWQHRKELYLCASRATAFLFFVTSKGAVSPSGMGTEIQELVRQLSTRSYHQDRAWRFNILQTDARRKMDVFEDVIEPEVAVPTVAMPVKEEAPKLPELKVTGEMTVRELAEALNQKPFLIVSELMKLKIMATLNQQLDFETITKVSQKFGYAARNMKAS